MEAFFTDMEACFITHKDLLSGVSSIATVLTLLVAAAALFFTAAEIRQSIRVTKATKIYEIQKDAREVARQLLTNNEMAKKILSKDIDPVRAQTGQLFNFYSAVLQQKRLGTLDERLWKPFENELRTLVNSDAGKAFWKEQQNAGQYYDQQFAAIINELQAARDCSARTLTT